MLSFLVQFAWSCLPHRLFTRNLKCLWCQQFHFPVGQQAFDYIKPCAAHSILIPTLRQLQAKMEPLKSASRQDLQDTGSDLSEQIKAATLEAHERAENTQLMICFQKGQITRTQYKVLLCSLYEIYTSLEEAMDRNSSHPAVAPIYFPQELDRTEALERDLEVFLGPQWRSRLIVPAATHRYAQRLRQIGKGKPELLVAHAYTRYLGDLSGGQVLGKLAQKAMRLDSADGLSFFSFPGVSSANRFKQLYRSRMNSIELSEQQRTDVLREAVDAFHFNIQVFDDLQKMLTMTSASEENPKERAESVTSLMSPVQLTLGLCVGLLTVCIGLYNY